MINLCEISFLAPNLVAFISRKEKNVSFFDSVQRAKDNTHVVDAKYRYVFVL